MEQKHILYIVDDGVDLRDAAWKLTAEIGDMIGSAKTKNVDGVFLIFTEHITILLCNRNDIDLVVLKFDEIFGMSDSGLLKTLKNFNDSRFEGSILDYVKSVENPG